jgi:hypothetical protein
VRAAAKSLIALVALAVAIAGGTAASDTLVGRGPEGNRNTHWDEADPARTKALRLCLLIGQTAKAHGLPPAFFARLIWKESLFDPRAVSPKGAQGVAQFMPETARRRGLADPFDPATAIPASAAFLAELRRQFGNLGLAAAAYNAGEDRIDAWLGERGGLPGETLAYVHAITYRPARWFREPGREVEPRPLDPDRGFLHACSGLPLRETRLVLYAGANWQPWGVHLATNISYDRAMARYARVAARYGQILGEGEPMVTRRRAGRGRRQLWSVGIGMPSRVAASRLCARLRQAGAACLVRRN